MKQALDYDLMRQTGRSFYVINLTAIDNGFPVARRAHTSLMINITDSDDQGPAFVYADCPVLDGFCTTPLYETAAKKSYKGVLKVWPGQIKAMDMDSMNNTVLYFIVKVLPEEFSHHFTMDPVTGEVTLTKPFDRDDIDAIHLLIKAEEKSLNRRSLTTTLRVQVVGDYYANYNDNFRNVPVNQAVEAQSHSSSGQTTVPVSLFIATVAVFFVVVISFPFIIIRVMKGKLLPEPPGVTSLQLTSECGTPEGSRKESSDTTTTSVLTCTSTDTGCTVYGPRNDNDDSDASSTSSSSSSSITTSPGCSVRLDFDDAISFASPVADPGRRVSSVSFDPEEVSARFSPPVPTKCQESTTARFKRRLSDLFNFRSSRDHRKARVRFDIRNVSNFS
nr:hypothetical protein BaRGS_025045 [Batillaria attramentaria]